MIADKILPSFYIIDLEGIAASLEFFIGTQHNIKKVSINSADFVGDVLAIAAAEKTLDFFRRNMNVVEDEKHFNPEFFPTQPAIIPTTQMLNEEDSAEQKTEQIEEDNVVTIILTRRFDEWGDFVVARHEISGDDFSINMKVAVHPRQYLHEKNLEKQEHIAGLYGFKLSTHTASIH